MKKKALTRKELMQRIAALESQDITRLAAASRDVFSASFAHFMTSGVIVTITSLDGRVVVAPTCITDGLSADSVAALHVDIVRSLDARKTFNKAYVP